jgi:ubiquinone biosynthesis O-methyltransferase
MEITEERLTLGSFDAMTEQEHLHRYEYVSELVAGKDVLDIACGSGYGSKLLAKAGASSVRGVDVSADAVRYASEHYANDRLTFEVGDAENLQGIADESFDVVVSFETIEHLNHVDRYLAEVRRVLKPGGIYFVSTPDRRLASSMYVFRGRPNNQYHVREFTRSELLEILGRNFNVQECLGQAYVSRALVFWPVQAFCKGFCYALRRFGAYAFIRKHYHLGSGLGVQKRDHGVARYWVVRCQKPAN